MMEDGQSNGRLADSTGTNESDGCEVFGQIDGLLDQLIASETSPRGRGRRFTKCARTEYKIMDLLVVQIPDLV